MAMPASSSQRLAASSPSLTGCGGVEVLPDRPAGEKQPGDADHQGRGPPADGADRVDELEPGELAEPEQEDDAERHPVRRMEGQEHEERHLPDRGEADEAVILGLHPHVGEIDHAGHRDEERRDQAPGRGEERRVDQGIGGNEDVGEIVDHEVEQHPVPVRGVALDVDAARQRAVDAVDDQREAEPAEHQPPIVPGRRHQGHQGEGRAGAGQEVHGERQRLGLHASEIRPKRSERNPDRCPRGLVRTDALPHCDAARP